MYIIVKTKGKSKPRRGETIITQTNTKTNQNPKGVK